MKRLKLKEDNYCWTMTFTHRKSLQDFIIEHKSFLHPQNDIELSLTVPQAKAFAKFVKENLKKEVG